MDDTKPKIGRPREWNREQIAKDMIEWSLLSDSINLCKFCGMNKIAPSKITEFARDDDSFRLAYEEAKANIGARREELLNQNRLHVKAYHLNATTYDHFMKGDIREAVEHEIKAKSAAVQEFSKEVSDKFEEHMAQLDSVMSDRKIAKSKIKIE